MGGNILNSSILSIGLPVYNGERYLKDTIRCLLNQTFKDFVLIISDNASTDSTQEICRSFQEVDNRIQYSRNEKNIGMDKNFNRTFELSDSEFFMWASYDDYWKSTFIEKCVTKLQSEANAVVCSSLVGFIDDSGEIESKKLYMPNDAPFFPKAISFGLHCIYGVFRSEALKKMRLMTPMYGFDQIFGLEFLLKVNGDIATVQEELFFYRKGPKHCYLESLSLSDQEKNEIRRIGAWTSLAKELVRLIKTSDMETEQKKMYLNELAIFLSQHHLYQNVIAENPAYFQGEKSSQNLVNFFLNL